MTIKIIVDSTADMLPSTKDQVTIVPLSVAFGDQSFIDGVTINHKEFYEKLIESNLVPTTSQPTPVDFKKVYEEIEKSGDTAIVLTISEKLSGTYQSAKIAKEGYENIYIIDSGSVTIGLGILVEYALELINKGIGIKEIIEELNNKKEKVTIIGLLDTLEYLKKGGRISKTAAFAGGLLNIKPVVTVADGQIKLLGKARGSKQGNNLLVTEIEKAGGIDFNKPILLGYTGSSDTLLKKHIEYSAKLWKDSVKQFNYTTVGSVIGTHAGPRAVGVAFFRN